MKRLTDTEILEAVRQACREESLVLASMMHLVDSDEGAVSIGGGLTPRIAYILGRHPGTVRRRLNQMQKKGHLLRHGKRTMTYRWWPVGLWLESKTNQQTKEQA